MNRKLHHSFTGLISSGVLALGLFAASPATLPGADTASAPSLPLVAALGKVAPLANDAALAAQVGTLALQLDPTAATPAEDQKAHHASGKSRRIRQSMAMPFFSFAPRG
jgi:hypothetical protein